MRGKHGDFNVIRQSIYWAAEFMHNETISIGGGEPTLHPDFFKILKICLSEFDSVWLATNGSQTDIMLRLSNIIEDCDYESFECDCDEETIEEYGCLCYEKYDTDLISNPENKLSVALSQDHFHSDINERIVNLWTKRAENKRYHYEIRNVTKSNNGIIAEGRAKKTGSGWNKEDCVCADLLIKPNGKIKLCGCKKSPIIGNTYDGVIPKWENIIYNSGHFNDTRCHKSLLQKKTKD